MSVEIKVVPDDKLQLVQTFIVDNSPSSDFFNITELPDTLSGGKNAFLIAGSDKLFPQSEVKVQVRDADGNVCYVEYANGNPEYFEGISKVVAVYVYPTTTAFGPATITVLGQATDVPDEWKFRYNVKWERQININPSLPNTTRVRFYKRPKVDIVETLEPIYRIESGSKVATNVTASFANINISQLETFAGDVKRVKVYRTSEGDISDYDLIQDILIESKELLTTFNITSSVKGNAGIFTNETLKLWNSGSLTSSLTNDRLDNGLRLSGSGIFKYQTPLSFTTRSTYEFNLDAFYSSSTASNLGVYISGSNNGIKLIGTLEGTTPVKNLEDTYFTFDLDKNESSASLYLSQSQGEWHVANLSLKLSEDSAFSPNQIDFITTMPTVVGNETFNFKFEFYDVNNNYVPVAITQSLLFTGGNNNIGGTISASNASILALSQSVSGTIGLVTASVSQSFVTSSAFSASLQSSSLFISASLSSSISSSLSSSFHYTDLLSSSLSASQFSASAFQFSYSAFLDSRIFTDANGKINRPPTSSSSGLYTGETYLGFYNGNEWRTYMDNQGDFYLTSSAAGGGFLAWDSATKELSIAGSITVLGGDAATQTYTQGQKNLAIASGSAAATSVSTSLAPNIFTDSTGKIVRTPTNTASNYGLYLGSSNLGFYSGSQWRTYMDNTGQFFLTGSNSSYLKWNGSTLEIQGAISVTGGNAATLSDTANAVASGSLAATTAGANAVTSGSASAAAAQTASELFAVGIGTNAVASGSASASAAQQAAIQTAKTDASSSITLLANGGWTAGSGTFISSRSISSPVLAGNAGYISEILKVGQDGITLDGGNKKIFVGTGTYNNSNTPFYFASGSTNVFSLGDKLSFNGSALNVVGAITAESGFIGTAAAGWSIASNKIFNTNIDIDNANNRIDFKSGGVVKTRIKSGNVNIGSTSTVSVTVAGAGTTTNSISGNDSPQYGALTALTATGGNTVEAYITTPSGVDGNNLALVIPYPALTSFGFAQCQNMGTGTSCQYGYSAIVSYTIRETNSVGTTVATGFKIISVLDWSVNFSTPFGNVNLPGFGGGSITIPSIDTAVSGKVYWIQVSMSTLVQARINPQGTDPLTANASLYVIAYGWDERTADAILLAVAPRAEFGTNGVQIGSAEGSYVALGDAAGAGNVGVFAGNISVTGTVAAGSVTASDIRAKTNIKTILNGIETIKKLNPVSYDWLQHITGNFEFEKGYGFIADDIQQIMPELIYEKKGYKYDDFKHLDYTSFHAIAIKAIQELTEKVEKLEAQISGSK